MHFCSPSSSWRKRAARKNDTLSNYDHVIIGAGIIGLSTAVALTRAGVPAKDIAIIDPAPISGASWVAGGMLAPVAEVQYGQEELYPLMIRAAELWPALREAVESGTDLPTGYREESTLVVAADRADATHLAELLEHQRAHGMTATRLPVRQARKLEPGLHPQLAGAVEIPGDHQVNPRLYCAAAVDVLKKKGATFVEQEATGLIHSSDAAGSDADLRNAGPDSGCTAVRLADGTAVSVRGSVYVCNGVGAATLDGAPALPVRPVRGDLIRLGVAEGRPAPVERVIRGFFEDRPIYVIPRTDGTIAVGATTREDERRAPAADGVYTLLRDAIRVVPGIEDCEFIEALAGERPGTPDDLPLIGKTSRNVVISAGYFRHGILLSALGAKVTAHLGLSAGDGDAALSEAAEAAGVGLDACRWDRFDAGAH